MRLGLVLYSFRLRLLGPARVVHQGQPVPGLAKGKAMGLLGYLAVQNRPLSREHLADLFWPDKSASRGRANLSWLLHFLSTRLPGCLVADWHTIRFERDSSFWLDVHAFAQLEALGDARSLMAAVDLYQGDLMEGLHLEGCADLQIWLVGERERWRQRVVQAMEALVVYHGRYGPHKEALRYAWRLLALEPWLEGTHRQVMRLLARDGQRGASLAQYETCRRILREELGVEPGAETQRLYAQIRDGELPAAPPVRTSPTGFYPPSFRYCAQQVEERPVFVARQREMARLADCLDRARAGQGAWSLSLARPARARRPSSRNSLDRPRSGTPTWLWSSAGATPTSALAIPTYPSAKCWIC